MLSRRPTRAAGKHSFRQAVFEQATMRLTFPEALLSSRSRIMSGDTLTAILNDKKKLQKIEMRNSYLRTMQPGHAAEGHGRYGFLF
jgi:hypothetical protein